MERLRTVRFAPYRKGAGPTFTLATYDAGERREGAFGRRSYLGYRLRIHDARIRTCALRNETLFEGDDIGLPPGTAIDSDKSIRTVMGWLTLKPGDTDSEYFDKYTKAQLEFCSEHADALAMCVIDRFGED